MDQTNTVYTWRNLSYTVPVQGGERKLLDRVQGYAKPGALAALIGASGEFLALYMMYS